MCRVNLCCELKGCEMLLQARRGLLGGMMLGGSKLPLTLDAETQATRRDCP